MLVRRFIVSAFGVLVVTGLSAQARADGTAQALPFSQSWTDAGLITVNDDWSGVPGIIGYRGDNLTAATGADPQSIVADGSATPVQVVANATVTNTTGGLVEVPGAVGFQGSGTADAPHLVIAVDTTGAAAVRVQYTLVDLDASADDSTQQVALQYRVGSTGDYTNVPAAYVADASFGPSLSGGTTAVDVLLPADAGNQARVELRIMTTNAAGNDELVGVDDIAVTGVLAASGTANPGTLAAGDATLLTVDVTPASGPTSTGITVTCDLTDIGGGAAVALLDDGTGGDVTAGDGTFSLDTTVAAGTGEGVKAVPCTVGDDQARSATASITITVQPVCGDGMIEGTEACDDGNTDDGDGCDFTCAFEAGFTCSGEPTVCADDDECTLGTDDCLAAATCNNTPGSYTCLCPTGYEGDGTNAGTGCVNIDECSLGTAECVAAAACGDTDGSYTCACPVGYAGDGLASGTGCSNVDECTLGTDDCVAAAACGDTDGSYTCTCPTGYAGDGTTAGTGCANVD
ncbi:MAG: DUF4215 domain-containing protein, partial [Myxococcales bacterium]|nr:DUF4215 domain-containing protein [Myxococcales bacterium]